MFPNLVLNNQVDVLPRHAVAFCQSGFFHATCKQSPNGNHVVCRKFGKMMVAASVLWVISLWSWVAGCVLSPRLRFANLASLHRKHGRGVLVVDDVNVVTCEQMAMNARSVSVRFHARGFRPLHVFIMSHRLQVFRIKATAAVAKVMDFFTVWNNSICEQVHQAVRAYLKYAVSFLGFVANPKPAWTQFRVVLRHRAVLINEGKEIIFKGLFHGRNKKPAMRWNAATCWPLPHGGKTWFSAFHGTFGLCGLSA